MVNLVENQGFVIVSSEVSHNAINCSRTDNDVKKEMIRANQINDSYNLTERDSIFMSKQTMSKGSLVGNPMLQSQENISSSPSPTTAFYAVLHYK